MATLFTKEPTTPIIQASRLTCLGMQYTVIDPSFLHIVTTNGAYITCSCSEPTCDHIQAVQDQQGRNVQADAYRDAYTALFDLSYVE